MPSSTYAPRWRTETPQVEILVIGPQGEARRAFAQRLAAHGPVRCADSAPAPLEAGLIVAFDCDMQPLVQVCERARSAKVAVLVFAITLAPTPESQAAALDAGAHDCAWVSIDDDALTLRLGVLRHRLDRRGERLAAEVGQARATRDHRALLQAVVSSGSEAVIVRDRMGVVTLWDGAAERIYGYSAEEAIGQDATFLAPPESELNTIHFAGDYPARYHLGRQEFDRIRKDGTRIRVQVDTYPVHDADGEVIGIAGVSRDATERRRVEEEHALLAAIVGASDDAIISVALDGRVMSWNRGAQKVYGYTEAEMMGVDATQLVPERHRDGYASFLAGLADGPAKYRMEVEGLHKDGHEVTLSTSAFPLRDAAGRVVAVASISRDVSEKRRTEAALRDSEANYRAVVEGTTDSLFVVDVEADGDFRVRLVNGYHAALTGQQNEQIAGKLLRELVSPRRYAAASTHLREVVRVRTPIEFEERTRFAHGPADIVVRMTPMLDAEGNCYRIVGSTRDVTAAKAAEAARAAAEQNLQAVVSHAPILISVFDAKGYNVLSMGAAAEAFGRQQGQTVGQHYSEYYIPGGEASDVIARALQGIPGALDIHRPDGRSLHATYAPHIGEDGVVTGVTCVSMEVTERVRAEEARQRADANYRAVVEGTSDALYVMERGSDGQFRCAAVNQAYSRLLDRDPQRYLGRTLYETHPREEAERILARYARAVELGAPVHWEATLTVRGVKVIMAIQATPVLDADGECLRIIGSMRDITERRQAEEAQRRTEEYLTTMVNSAPILLLGVDMDGVLTFTAGAGLAKLGSAPGQSVGRSIYDLYPDTGAVAEAVRTALAGGSATVEIEAGGYLWDTRYSPMHDEAGNVTGAIGVIFDITERRRTETTLITEKAFTDASIDSLPGVFYLFTASGRILRTNRHFKRVTGYSDEELADLSVLALVRADEQDAIALAIETVIAEGMATVEGELLAKDGSITPYFFTGKRIEVEGELCVVGMGVNVSERRVAEQAIRESEANLRAVFDSATEGITLISPERRVLNFNAAASALTLATMAGPLERGGDLRDIIPAAMHAAFEGRVAKALAGRPSAFEREIATESGSIWLEIGINPVRMDDGKVSGVALAIRDVTERKRSEDALVQAQKLESLGVLAGGIAHDFNNLLVGILGNAGLALAELPPASPARETIEDIETAGKRAADLARQMLAYSGKGRFVVQSLQLNELVEEMTHLLRVSIARGALLKYDFAPGLPPVEVDATQLRQVVMNLVVNASDAIGGGDGVIAVTTGEMVATRAYLDEAYLSPELPEGRYVFLEVADTGAGMDAATMARIFDPFYTTKFTGRGLGLAAVLGIMRGHRGAIRVSSEPGRGTTFRLLLPAASGDVIAAEPAAAVPPAWRGSGTVLVVDDEPTVRTVTIRALTLFGFDAIEAPDGIAGVEAFAEHASGLACVLLDMTMPRLNGEDAFQQMRRIRPGVPIILMSGYSEHEAATRFGAEGLAGFIQKPYDVRTLRDVLRSVLG